MNEILNSGFFSDLWKIYYDKKLVHTEALNTDGFNKELLKSQSILNSNCAISTIILVGKKFLDVGDKLSKLNLSMIISLDLLPALSFPWNFNV